MFEASRLLFEVNGQRPWMVSHGCTPTAFAVSDRIRILFAPRDAAGRSIPSRIDIRGEPPWDVIDIGEQPIMELGELGTFDDDGIMPCSVVAHDGRLYLYYVGWNRSVSVPYRNAIGVAVSDDHGLSFARMFPGAVVDRNREEPFFTASPHVLVEGGRWRLWYASTIGYVQSHGRPEPIYVLKDAVSQNGVDWHRPNRRILPQLHPEEAQARPCVLKGEDGYRMWYCYRGSRDFRNGSDSYRIGYATSLDGEAWTRRDEQAGLGSGRPGLDARMQTYPNLLRHEGRLHLFYNGDGFGSAGICHAIWDDR
jgi:hypothetical protein